MRISLIALLVTCFVSTSAIAQTELTDHQIELIKLRIEQIHERDQQFRGYTFYGTLDEATIDGLRDGTIEEIMKFQKEHESELSEAQVELLQELQRRNDRRNHEAFCDLVNAYGYPSPDRLGVESDMLYPVLLHPPVKLEEIESHLKEMQALLKPQVEAGNLKPRMYATFVDNMLGKILRRPQLYGTNQVFNRSTGQVEPPVIADIEQTNAARTAIGMPPLKEGEYRIVESK